MKPTISGKPEWADKLRAYQLEMAEWLVDQTYPTRGKLCADGLGVGKTREALAAMRLRFERGIANEPLCLTFTSANSVFDWAREANAFWPELKVVMFDSGKAVAKRKTETAEQFKERKEQARLNADWQRVIREGASEPTLLIGDYYWADLSLDMLLEHNRMPDQMNLDEAHQAKNAGAKRTQAIHKHCARSRQSTLITATPVHDRAVDLHNLKALMDARFKDNLWKWARDFYSIETKQTMAGEFKFIGALKDKEALDASMKHLIWGRTAQELMGKDLPARNHQLKMLDVAGAVRMSPGKLRAKKSADVEELLRSMTKHKLDAAVDIALEAGRPAIFYTYRREDASELVRRLQHAKLTATLATGDLTTAARDKAIQGWKLGASTYLVCTMDAVKESATLTRADLMVFVDLTVMPTTMLQCQGRIDPARQAENERRPVNYYYLVTRGGPDEVVAETLIEKLREASGIGVKNGQADGFADFLAPLDKRPSVAKALDPEELMKSLIDRLNARADRLADLGML